MAEKPHKKPSSSRPINRQKIRQNADNFDSKSDDMEETKTNKRSSIDCPVCLQACIHPVKLPCGHIFCFLCVKGAANHSRRCALCRQSFPPDYFDHPDLLEAEVSPDLQVGDKYAWFYEGRSGWWQYEERTNTELEESYRSKKRSFELLIAGNVYIIDLDSMVQLRRSDPSRRRRIKRDLVSAPKKGIAGLKFFEKVQEKDQSDENGDEGIEGADAEGADVATGGTGVAPLKNGGTGTAPLNEQSCSVKEDGQASEGSDREIVQERTSNESHNNEEENHHDTIGHDVESAISADDEISEVVLEISASFGAMSTTSNDHPVMSQEDSTDEVDDYPVMSQEDSTDEVDDYPVMSQEDSTDEVDTQIYEV